MGYSQNHPAILSQDQSSSSNGSSIPLSPESHGSSLRSPRRHAPAPDEPSYLPLSFLSGAVRFFLPTRASVLGSASESDRNSCSESFLSKHSFSEDLNNCPSNSAVISASHPGSSDSGSLDYNEPSSHSLTVIETCDCTVCTQGSKLGSGSGPDNNSCTDSFLSKHSFSEDLNHMLGSTSEPDRNSCSDSILSKHSFDEDLNNSPPNSAFASYPDSLDSDSLNYNQPSSPKHLSTPAWRPRGDIMSSYSTPLSSAENRSPVTSASSPTQVS